VHRHLGQVERSAFRSDLVDVEAHATFKQKHVESVESHARESAFRARVGEGQNRRHCLHAARNALQ
jgi:hypothetical protein